MLSNLRFRRHRERLYTWLVALAGLALAFGAAQLAGDQAHSTADEGFRREVAPRVAALEAAIARDVQMVRSLAALMATRSTLSADDFRAFVDVMRADVAGILALQWMPRVDGPARAGFEAEAAADFPGYQLREPDGAGAWRPAAERAEYFPVRFIEPLLGNESLPGVDFATGPLESAAMQRALQRLDVAASERLALVQDTDVRHAVLLVAPVFDASGGLRGYVGALVRVDVMLEAALATLAPVGLDIHVTDATGPGRERALHVFSDRLTAVSDLARLAVDERRGEVVDTLVASHDLAFADRTWRVYVEPGPGYYPPVPPVPAWLAAGLVLLVTGVITVLLLLMQKRAQLLARASLSDGLTGLANRAFCERMLAAEWERAVRHGHHLSLLLVDIDAFTAYNRQAGVMAGDEALRLVAGAIAAVPARASDIPCRYAGDRFAVVLPDTDHEGARLLGERVLGAVRALDLARTGPGPRRLTASVVAATARPRRGELLEDWVAAANALLDSPGRGDGDVLLGVSAAPR